ncbi:GH92 family glycosyl hydrolase [Solibaculum mannosilyticum]|uniref:F5/8 type C domain-containing protein n=1 Tax=Solibaculum mannosilyticum TaxID=2780922 RepID=A0A7I8D1Q7_9FIRM|nr:GH92 family glycosyl hydrolase [Solibaculum mannosilyticum]BCI60750.1 hypothetical protein C12CBH8_13890 [Solibaculum mannosilyticum]
MKRLRRLLAIAMVLALSLGILPIAEAVESTSDQTYSHIDYVNPYIGTAYDAAIHSWGQSDYGGTVPSVAPPFGMTKWTPQTRRNSIGTAAYRYDDQYITGFQATHQPAIWMGDFGYLTIMPGVDSVKTSTNDRRLSFTHEDETVSPYYYSVDMDAGSDRTITGEMTATSRTGVLRFTYPENDMANIYVEMTRSGVEGSVVIDPEKGEIYGYNPDRMDSHLGGVSLPNFKGYYVIQFSKPFQTSGVTQDGALKEGVNEITGNNVGAYVTFDTAENEMVEVRVASSFISFDQARDNLKREQYNGNTQLTFDEVKQSVKDTWEEKLDVIDIEGASDEDMHIFYTGMYHSLQYPVEFSEYGRYYSAYDDSIHVGDSYTSFSLWDTFRAQNSMLTLVAPERVPGMINSLINAYHEGGYMPKWPNPSYTNIMIGTPADSVVAEAVNKGLIDGVDLEEAYEAVLKDGMVPPENDTTTWWGDRQTGVPYEARAGLTYYMELGYVPADKTAEAGSNTLEGAYEDWCIAQVAKALGKQDDYEYFIQRSQNYKNMFNPETNLLEARNYNGEFAGGGSGWTEGKQMNYAYCVLQDVTGLMNLMGDNFNSILDNYFATGQNFHSNEPSHHYAYLYDYSGKPSETQRLVRQIADEHYANDPAAGMTGNSDCGQMSSWYLFTAMGFYPVNPASGEYMIGSPFFDKVTIHTGDKDFEIIAHNNSEENMYIQSATLNGEALDIPVLTHEQIVNGGKIEFEMGSAPSDWGSDYRDEALPTYEDTKTPDLPDSWTEEQPEEPEESDNLALTAECTSDAKWTSADIGGSPDKINDGNIQTGFLSGGMPLPAYFTLTWEEPQSFDSMWLYANYNKAQAPYSWDIEVSENGVDNWQTVGTVEDAKWETSQESREGKEFTFDRVENVKGFRIKVNKAYGDWGHYTIHEIEIYDSANRKPTISTGFYKNNVSDINHTIALSSGEMIANATLESGSELQGDVVLAAVLYKDGRMVDTSLEKFALSGNQMNLSISFEVPEGDLTHYEARLMLLDAKNSAPMTKCSSIR